MAFAHGKGHHWTKKQYQQDKKQYQEHQNNLQTVMKSARMLRKPISTHFTLLQPNSAHIKKVKLIYNTN